MKNLRTEISIGIPAYQAEGNIGRLLRSLSVQKERNILVEEILVYADACTDNTVSEVKKVRNKKIRLIEGKKNKGYAFGLQKLIEESRGEIFVSLNDDIKITSKSVIENLVNPLLEDKKVGLVSGNICALKPKTFIGRCIYTSYLAFKPLRLNYKNGETRFTNDGKIMAMSRSFAGKLRLDRNSVGNVDIYIYLRNLQEKNLYKFARNASVYFRLPETVDDFRSQELRVRKSQLITEDQFKSLAAEEWRIPEKEYWISLLKVFLRFPIEALFFKLYINNFLLLKEKTNFKTWNLALSTKKL